MKEISSEPCQFEPSHSDRGPATITLNTKAQNIDTVQEEAMNHRVMGIALLAALMVAGCSKIGNPVSAPVEVPVNLSVAFSQSAEMAGITGGFSSFAADSLTIDSAIVVLARIKFESHDSVDDDTDLPDSLETDDDEDESNVKFRGPFVVRVRDTFSIDFASQTLPAGIYNAIKIKIHRLKSGEDYEDSDEHDGKPRPMVNVPYESSIIVWGSVLKNGVWTPFEFKFNGEFEFAIRGNFVVEQDVSSVNIALNFDLASWFVNPFDGSLLDPTELSETKRELFLRAIKKSFGQGRCGRDDDEDGHPDED